MPLHCFTNAALLLVFFFPADLFSRGPPESHDVSCPPGRTASDVRAVQKADCKAFIPMQLESYLVQVRKELWSTQESSQSS